MNLHRKKSKSKAFWKHGRESVEARRARLTAARRVKDRLKKRILKKHANPTPEMRAEKAEKDKEAALKLFKKWLDSPAVTGFVMGKNYNSHYGLPWHLKHALTELGDDLKHGT